MRSFATTSTATTTGDAGTAAIGGTWAGGIRLRPTGAIGSTSTIAIFRRLRLRRPIGRPRIARRPRLRTGRHRRRTSTVREDVLRRDVRRTEGLLKADLRTEGRDRAHRTVRDGLGET